MNRKVVVRRDAKFEESMASRKFRELPPTLIENEKHETSRGE